MKQVRSRIHRRSAKGAFATALTLSAAMGVGATPADAATTVRVRSVVRTQVAVSQASGAIVSIVHVCPFGSDLDRPMTKSLIARTPPSYRLLSRELWPRGMVTRWRQTGPMAQVDNPPLPQQTVACVRSGSPGLHGVLPTSVSPCGSGALHQRRPRCLPGTIRPAPGAVEQPRAPSQFAISPHGAWCTPTPEVTFPTRRSVTASSTAPIPLASSRS